MSKFVITATTNPIKTNIDYTKELNQEQLDVVLHGDGPCLVLAGAGSGKTRTIVYRVAHLLEKGVDPRNILLLTFTNKAANEMMGRVEMLLGAPPKGLWGGTFHSVSHRVLRVFAREAGYQENFSILDEEDSASLIKTIIGELGIDTKARRFPSASVIKSILSFTRNSCLPLEDVLESKYKSFVSIFDELQKIISTYGDKKRQANVLDFDDLLIVFLNLLKSNQTVAERLSNQFHYILVDEYQDTNAIQAELVTTLAKKHKNILVVGDDAQSIYSFRAATVRNILDFPKNFENAKIFKLETNYRSTPEILNLANDIIKNNREQFPKNLKPVRQPYIRPQFAPATTSAQEANFIAEKILALRDEGVKLENIAVLFRATHHSQALEFELAKRDIPYEYRGGMKFFERSHIKDVLAFLRVRANTSDQLAWMRILSLQIGIGPTTAQRLAVALGEAKVFEDALKISVDDFLNIKSRLGWDELAVLLRKILDPAAPNELIEKIAESDEYKNYLSNEYPNWQERLEDLKQLAMFANRYEELSQFLGEVSLFDDYGGARSRGASFDDERIVLSTIHQAKGLEWDVVFVMSLTSENFPNRRALLEDGGIEEERRLFYVATTRAGRELYLTYPITSGYDSLAICQPSPFIEEIGQNLFEEIEIEEKYGERVIELDQNGEEKPRRKGFLRDVDEL